MRVQNLSLGSRPLRVSSVPARRGDTSAPCELLQELGLKTEVGGQAGLPVQVFHKPLGQSIKAIHQTSP